MDHPFQSSPAPASFDARNCSFAVFTGATGVLLIHGFGGDPTEVLPLAGALIHDGYSVYAPLLPGHGALPDAMTGVRWQQWVEAAAHGFSVLRQHCTTIVVAGFSMGGLLALILAAHLPVARLAVLAPALRLRGQPLVNLSGVARHVVSWYYPLAGADFSDPELRALLHNRVPDANLDDPLVCDRLRRMVRVPLDAVHQLTLVQRSARRLLPRVTAPTLIVQGRNDQTVDPRSAEQILRHIGSVDCQLVWMEGYGHQLLVGDGGERTVRTIMTWIRDNVGRRT